MIYQPGSWDLSKISPKDIEKELKEIETKVVSLERKRKELKDSISAESFLKLVKELELIKQQSERLAGYAHLKFCEDSADVKAVALMSHLENKLTLLGNRLLFFNLWFKQLPEKEARQLICTSGDYEYHFRHLRQLKKYALKENEEKIINLKDLSGVSALNNVYNIFTSQFRFRFRGKELTQEELTAFVRDPDPRKREEAYLLLLGKYKKYKDVIGEIYKNIVIDWQEENVGLRGYKGPISVRNSANDIPDKAVEALLNVCEKNKHIFQKFFEMKRKKLGLKKIRRFDLYAPIIQKKEKDISYDESVNLVLSVFDKFSPLFKAGAVEILKNNHIHSKIQKNKQSGAFCSSVNAKLAPYVLLNYTGKLRDVSTMAHELGHGIHHILASDHSDFTFHPCLPLAETASIFSEMILSEEMMKKNPQKAKELLFFKLDELYASIIRQAGFVSFEKKAHQMIKEGRTIDDLSKVYLADLRKQLGSKVDVDEIYAYEWCYVPHIFYTPFYCYAYAFGNLLTLALYELYKENPSFRNKIIAMLALGRSKSPLEITKSVGVDITSEKFWQKGFDVIRDMLSKVKER